MSERFNGEPLAFTDFRRIEFTFIAHLNQFRETARRLELHELMNQLGALQTVIEEHSFSIAVVGEFKRGKSTFINALLGKEILPSDIAPTSATLNRVRYGLRPLVKVVFKATADRAQRVEEIGIDQLPEYVTKLTPEAARTASQVEEAIVYYPTPFCHNNVSIIDTPGLNDDAAMTAVTMGVLTKVDTAIFVLMPESPFGGTEGAFLHQLLINDVGKTMFVVTGIDRVRGADNRERLLRTVKERIRRALTERVAEVYGAGSADYAREVARIGDPKVFGLSGYDALEARVTNNHAMLVASGFLEFEKALTDFLAVERGAVAFKAMADRLFTIGTALNTAIAQRVSTMEQEERDLRQIATTLRDWERRRQLSAAEDQALNATMLQTRSDIAAMLQRSSATVAQAIEHVIMFQAVPLSELTQVKLGALQTAVPHQTDAIPQGAQNTVPAAPPAPAVTALVGQTASTLEAQLHALLANAAEPLHRGLGEVHKGVSQLFMGVEAFLCNLDEQLKPLGVAARLARQALQAHLANLREARSAVDRLYSYHTRELHKWLTSLMPGLDIHTCVHAECLKALPGSFAFGTPAEQVAKFKKRYSTALTAEVAQRIAALQLSSQLDTRAKQAFAQVRVNMNSVITELETAITLLLDTIQDIGQRRQAMIEFDLRWLDERRRSTNAILDDVRAVSATVTASLE